MKNLKALAQKLERPQLGIIQEKIIEAIQTMTYLKTSHRQCPEAMANAVAGIIDDLSDGLGAVMAEAVEAAEGRYNVETSFLVRSPATAPVVIFVAWRGDRGTEGCFC